MEVEDYKVFLNPEKIAEFSDATKLSNAKKSVIKAWRDGGLLGNDNIFLKFKKFDTDNVGSGILNSKSDLENFLLFNDDWFIEIFKTNLK